MKKLSLFFLILFFVSTSSVFSSRYIQLEILVEEGTEGGSSNFQLVDQRKMVLREGKENFSFQGNFTLYVTPTIIEDKIFLSVDLYTLGPEVERISKELLVASGELLEYGQVKVKNDRIFRVRLRPSVWEVPKKMEWCDYSPQNPDDFYSEVSVHYTIYYMKNSLADYHWLKNKDFLERIYRTHKEFWRFSYPEKITYVISPYLLSRVGWDFRFHSALDPVKNSVYSVYNKDIQGIFSPFAMELLHYKYWGYAPKFIVEGLAGEKFFAHYYAKKLKEKESLCSLSSLKLSRDYRAQPMEFAFYSASSFVGFLIERYGKGEFKRFYQEVTDLTLDQALFSIYKKSLAQLEKEWHDFLDEYSPPEWELFDVATFMLSNKRYDQSIVLLKDLLKRKSGEDKLRCLYHLTNAYFMAGRYSDAASTVLEMTKIKPEDPELLNALGNNYYFDGRDSLAKEAFERALEFSPNYGDCYYKLGQLSLKQKDFETSLFYFTKAESLSSNLLELIDANLSLGETYDFLEEDSLKKESYKRAKEYSERFLRNAPDNSLSYLKMGQSLLGLNQLSFAIDYLNGALFMEKGAERLGEIYLALGRAYHKKGELVMAESLYRKVLLAGSGKLEKEKAEEFLEALY